jgi:pimeloyl-ACP methyl ester carboxylesterase
MKLLAKTKAERPGSAEEVLAELDQAATKLAGGPSTSTVRDAAASSPFEQEIRFCTSADGTRIAYATYGEPAARALVLVRDPEIPLEAAWNYPGTRAGYESLTSGRRLVTFDRRGVGGSQRDVDDLAVSGQVADFSAVVDELGLETFDLMAWVYGAGLAAAYAAEHPERVGRFVLWRPMMRTSGSPLAGFQDMVQSIRANWSFARRSMAAIVFPRGPTQLQRTYSNMLRDSLAPEVYARHLEVIAEFDGRASLGNVQAPALALASGIHDSEIASVRAVASLIPDARFVTLERATDGLGELKLLYAALRSFLAEG